jgi:hypothetical protein
MATPMSYGKSITEQIRDGERSCAEALLLSGPSPSTRQRWIKAHIRREIALRIAYEEAER